MVDVELAHGDVPAQVTLMHPAERPQEVTYARPQPFDGVGVDFAHPVAIVVARPLLPPVRDGRMRPRHVVVPTPLVGADARARTGEPLDVPRQGRAVRPLHHPQADLAAAAPDCADYRRAVVLISPMPPPLVSPPARRVGRVGVFFAFPPPHSETSR